MQNSLESLKHHFENAPFALSCGMRLLELRPGYAKTVMPVDNRHFNGVGTVHGGAIFTLADYAFGIAARTGGKVVVAVNTSISFVKAVRSGTLYAEAIEIARSRKISTCTVRVTDETGDLVAVFQGTGYIKEEPFPPVNVSESC